MGKDRSGKYHPAKGKPSGAKKEEGLGMHPTEPEKLDQYLDITDRYTTGEDEIAPHVPVRHPNRNTEKGHRSFNNQQDNQDNRHDPHAAVEAHSSINAEELPRILTKEEFALLANHRSEHCISIYLPTHASGVEVNEQSDRIAFKSTLREVAGSLKSKGMDQVAVERLLAPAYKLIQDDPFWINLSNGLAVFIADEFCKYIKLPAAPLNETLINSSFFVSPLRTFLTAKEYFYLLVISKKQVKLFRANSFGMEYILVPGLSKNAEEQAEYTDPDAVSRAAGAGGDGTGNSPGEWNAKKDQDKVRIASWLEAADDIIWKEILHTETVPLMLAGVEYLIPIYRTVTDYKHVYEEALTGNHERDDIQTLYALAMEKMAPYFRQRETKALELYGNQSATALTSSILSDVIPATYYGQVSHLFVQRGVHVWGTFDEMANELKLHDSKEEDSEDLLDKAAVKTLLTGGDVFFLEKEEMPVDSVVAAVLRY